jgi:NADH:ubiquinone oxidoreductase subunit 5 (subunit L)/multisubunit Na+/H+ antiporter MnhA subunit
MKPTKLSLLALISLPATIAAFFVASFMVGRGLQVPVSPTNLLITLAAISAVLLALSIPIWRYRSALKQSTTQHPKRVDPFYAVRVLLLAKASSLAGVLFASWHLGVLVFQISGEVVIQNLVLQNALGFLASLLLVIAALITEQICRLPQDQDPDTDQAVRT